MQSNYTAIPTDPKKPREIKDKSAMRKSKMTENQINERAYITSFLRRYGWMGPTQDDLFENNKLCIPEAIMEYNNEFLKIEVSYGAEYRYIL